MKSIIFYSLVDFIILNISIFRKLVESRNFLNRQQFKRKRIPVHTGRFLKHPKAIDMCIHNHK